MDSYLPMIGISGFSAESASVRAMVALLEERGAKTILLMEREVAKIPAQIEALSALVVMGNDYDIDPAEYGAARHAKTKSPRNPAPTEAEQRAFQRMVYEKALVRAALVQKLPLLGVCGGMQRINVELGGTLKQHSPDQLDHAVHLQKAEFCVPVQLVRIDDDSVLGKLAEPSAIAMPAHGAKEGLLIAENSIHHQAVEKLAVGLKANAKSIEATAEQDIVEGFEIDPEGPLKDLCILGLQFHPEFRASDLGPAIAGFLLENAIAYAKAKAQGQAFNRLMVYKKAQQQFADPLTTIAKSNINLKALHQLGVFRSIEELRQIPAANIQQALVQEHTQAPATPPRAPPTSRER